MWYWLTPLIALAALTGLVVLVRSLRSFGTQVQVERARELFRLQRERLEAQFMKAAELTGKPRGLLWKDCQWENDVIFVRDRKSGQIAALVGVTIQFEAVPGGDMEGLPAVGNLRNASAVFYFTRGNWATVGRAVFNMNPGEALLHFKNQYESIAL
jgi:hypothetical protein